MKDILVGLLAVAAGLMFCFRGYLLMRIVIPVWGFFVGFALGGAIISAITDRAFLGTVLGWIVGIVIGVVFAFIAYTYYAVAVVLTMGTVGYLLGSTLMVALDVRWNWVVVAVGVVVGFVLALGAILIDLPTVVLTVVTALSGATATIGGVMLIVNRLDLADLGDDAITSQINASWGWWLAYLVLALAGVFAQVQATENVRASVRSTWKTAATPPA
jgi:hypothetical protein